MNTINVLFLVLSVLYGVLTLGALLFIFKFIRAKCSFSRHLVVYLCVAIIAVLRCILFSTSAIWLPDNRYNETNSKSLFPINYFDQHPSWYIIENIPFTLYPFLFLPVMLHWIRVFVLSRAIEKSVYDKARNATISITVIIFIALNCFYLCQFAVPNNRIFYIFIFLIEQTRFILDKFASVVLSFTIVVIILVFLYLGHELKIVIGNVPIDLKMRKDKLREMNITLWLCTIVLFFRIVVSLFTWEFVSFSTLVAGILLFLIYIICEIAPSVCFIILFRHIPVYIYIIYLYIIYRRDTLTPLKTYTRQNTNNQQPLL